MTVRPDVDAGVDRVVYGRAGKLSYAGVTHPGLRRKRNEDTLWVDEERSLFIVADGMGGHRRGAEAARAAVVAVGKALEAEPGTLVALMPEGLKLRIQLRQAFRAAHDAVRQSAPGGGTTMDAVLFHEGTARVAHVGDSRVYLLRSGRMEVLTRDHTVGADRGSGTDDDGSAESAALTRAIGVDAKPCRPDHRTLPVHRGDRLLLCSDGLAGPVPDDRIRDLLKAHWDDPVGASRALVGAALDAGGADNVTVLVVSV